MKTGNILPNRKKIRLEGYDYSNPANYFVTIVTQNRSCLFGEIKEGEMILNDAGEAINQAILHLPDYHPNVLIPHYVVMPNHVHLIITQTGDVYLSEIIRRFKSYTTNIYSKGVKQNGWIRFNKKLWQHNYYEHIIRNQLAYDYIANYIYSNPQRWMKDAINPQHDDECDEVMKQVLMFG